MASRIDMRLPVGPEAAGMAREALDSLEGLRGHTMDDLRLLVSELVTNSFRHAGLPRAGFIGLRVADDGRAVRVEVTDYGAGFEPPANPRPGEESGWGLYLVDRVADRWGVTQSDRTCVWFEIGYAGRLGV